jgi:excisionase family DNA binding protein
MQRVDERPLSFLSASDVADLLKLNHQVVLRKLQSGEIPGYKIGKDWRIEEAELRAWLRSVSNQPRGRSETEEERIRRNFFEGGRLKQIPAKRSVRDVVLRILARSFETERIYRETEVNDIISGFHADFCTLRRELIMAKLLLREKGKYWRPLADVPEGGAAPAQEASSGGSEPGGVTAPHGRT